MHRCFNSAGPALGPSRLSRRGAAAGVAVLGLSIGLAVLPPSAARAVATTPATPGTVSLLAGGPGNGPGLDQHLTVTALAADSSSLYLGQLDATGNGLIRRVDRATGLSTVVAGGGRLAGARTDVPATQTVLDRVSGIEVQPDSSLLFAMDGEPYRLGAAVQAPIERLATGRRASSDGRGDISRLTDGRIVVGGSPTHLYGTDGRASTALGQAPVAGLPTAGPIDDIENVPGLNVAASPASVVSDGAGGFYYADPLGVRQYSAAGIVTTRLLTASFPQYDPDPDVPAANRTYPRADPDTRAISIGRESDGSLLILDGAHVDRLAPNGTITLLAGGGTGDESAPGPATSKRLYDRLLTPDGQGGFFLADDNLVRHVDAVGTLTVVAGTARGYSGDGGPATDATLGAAHNRLYSTVGPDGTIYVSDPLQQVVRAIAPVGIIRTVAGRNPRHNPAEPGDDGPALEADLDNPTALATDAAGDVFFLDGRRVRRVDAAGHITTLMDDGSDGTPAAGEPFPKVVPGLAAFDLAVDPAGDVYVARGSGTSQVLRLTPDGQLSIAYTGPVTSITWHDNVLDIGSGTTVQRLHSDGTTDNYASLSQYPAPSGYSNSIRTLTSGPNGSLYVLMYWTPLVRIDADGSQHAVAGVGCSSCAGDTYSDGLGTGALDSSLDAVGDLAADGNDVLVGTDTRLYRLTDLQRPAYAPSRPQNVAAAPAGGSTTVSWTAPRTDGGDDLTGYRIDVEPGSHTATVSPSTHQATVSGLTNGTRYTVTVTATNAVGDSQAVPAPPVTPVPAHTPPSAPVDVWISPAANGVVVGWSPPLIPGSSAVSSYTVRSSSGSSVTVPAGASSTSVAMPAGRATSATVTSANGDGTGAASPATPTVVSDLSLGSPRNVRTIPHPNSITTVWDNPATVDGHPLTAACARITTHQWARCAPDAGNAVSLPETSPYDVTVSVQGADDLQSVAAVESGTTYTTTPGISPAVPGAPASANATTSGTTVTVSWTPPSGGGPIGNYIVSLEPDGRSLVVPSSARSVSFPSAAADRAENATVQADGDGGLSAPARTSTVTPTNPPAAAVSLGGSSIRTTTYGATVTLTGTANPGATVGVWFHKANTTGYVQRRTLVATSTGTWTTTYTADDDYRVYATNGTAQSANDLIQIAPTITGPTTRTVKKNSTVTISGTGTASTTVTIHFHKAGTAATDYSILRTTIVSSTGTWSRTYLASVDYRYYATLPNGRTSPTVLAQAR